MNILTIIIPINNKERYIISTLNSVIEQIYTDWECIIVDDASTDNSLKLVKNFINSHKNYNFKLIINSENKGVSISRNIALKEASGKYILPLDADDLLMPSYTFEGVNFLEKNSEYSMFYGCSKMILNGKTTFVENVYYEKYEDLLSKSLFTVSAILRKDLIKVGWNPNLEKCEDWDFYINYLYHNDKIKFSSIPNIVYRLNANSRSNCVKRFDEVEKIKRPHIEKYREYNKVLRIGFIGFWEGGDIELFKYRAFYKGLNHILYEEKNPYKEECDLVFISVFDELDKSKLKGDPILISYRGEPKDAFGDPEKYTDFHIGFVPEDEFNHYLPIWRIYYGDLKENKQINPTKTEFCAFIVSNSWGEERNKIFDYINDKYKRVDSLGRYKNNVGCVLPKRDFKTPSKYKFIICYENSKSDADYMYITEKIIWAFTYGCIPIYWGNSEIEKYFNPKAFINANNFTEQEILEKIKEIDTNDEMYQKMLNEEPLTTDGINFIKYSYLRYYKFLKHVFEYYGKSLEQYE